MIEPAAAEEIEQQDDADVLYQEMTEAAAALMETKPETPAADTE